MKNICFLYIFPNCYGQMEGLCARRAAPHVQNTPKKCRKWRLNGVEKRAKYSKKTRFYYNFCLILLTHFCCFLCDFFTFLGRLFGANRRTFAELFWHTFSRFARARAFRQKRTRKQANFGSRVRARLPGHFDVFFHRFGDPFCIVFGSFFWLIFAPFLRFFVVFCRCFVGVFSLRFHTFGLFFARVVRPVFSPFLVRFSHTF